MVPGVTGAGSGLSLGTGLGGMTAAQTRPGGRGGRMPAWSRPSPGAPPTERDPLPPHAQVLRGKAEQRNPDEFYFAMERQRTKGGVHQTATAEANKHSQEELQLMRTQDVGYLRLKAQTEAKVGAARWACV